MRSKGEVMPQSKGKHAGVRAELMDARGADESAVARGVAAAVARGAAAPVARGAAAPVARSAVAAVARGAAAPVARGAAAPEVPGAAAPVPSGSRCEAALLRVLLQAGLLRPGAASAGTGSERADALRLALQQLEPEMALKIRALLVAGRDGQRVDAPAPPVTVEAGGSAPTAFSSMTIDADETGPGLVDYLRRGHAIACAMDIDVDSPIANWRAPLSPDLDERAWLSFGKQLAGGKPGDWQGFGVPEAPAQGFSKIYLKLGDNAWWSFQAMLDRPTTAGVAKERRALSKRRLKGVSVQTLEALAGQLGNGQGRAFRRASRAIRARVGQLGPSLAPLRK